jgi:hypothetical protein
VLAQAYTLDGRLGVLMVNLHRAEAVRATVPLEVRAYGLSAGRYSVEMVTASARHRVATMADAAEVSIDLPPREFVLIEARKEG